MQKWTEGKTVRKGFDIVRAAEGPMRTTVVELKGIDVRDALAIALCHVQASGLQRRIGAGR